MAGLWLGCQCENKGKDRRTGTTGLGKTRTQEKKRLETEKLTDGRRKDSRLRFMR